MIYPKINVIGLCGSELNGVQVDHIFLKTNGSFEYKIQYNFVQFTHKLSLNVHYRK